MKPVFRFCLTSFRISAHTLAIEQGRHAGLPRIQRVCLCDKITVEDEFHFCLVCPVFKDIRCKCIAPYYYLYPSPLKFSNLPAAISFIKDCPLVSNL